MEKEMQNKKGETNALTPISQNDRQGWVSLAFVQAGICVCAVSFLEGALLAESMPLGEAILSGTIGYALVVIVMTIIGMQGSDLGMATCTLTESTFGKKGARYIVSIIFAINLIGWYGINNGICGEAFMNFMSEFFNINIPLIVCNLSWGIIMLLTAVYGMKAMEKLNFVSIPVLMIVMVVGTVMALQQFGTANMNAEVVRSMSFMGGVSLSFDFYAVGVITAADITRFQKSRKDTLKSTVWGIFPMGVITLALGAILTNVTGEYDIGMVLIKVGMPLVGVIAIILSTWTTNSANAYSGGLDLVMSLKLPDNKRREITIIAGVIGTVLGAFGILNHVEGVLSMLAFLVCPIGGILLADYWIVGKGKPENWHSTEGFNLVSIATWAVSAVLAYLTTYGYTGIIFAFVIYLILERFLPSKSREAVAK